MYYVYKHTRLDKNEPFYIGIGTKLESSKSIRAKYKRAYHKTYRNPMWKNIVAKTAYRVEILLESPDRSIIEQKEIEYILLFGRKDIKTGTLANMTSGGDGINEISKESRRKAADAISKVIYQYDIKGNYLQSYKSVTSASKKYKINKSNLSTVALGTNKSNTVGGFRWSFTKVDKLEKLVNYKKKAIYQLSKEGEMINKFNSLVEAQNITGTSRHNISSVASGRLETSGGYKWSYNLT